MKLKDYMRNQMLQDSGALDGICKGCGADDDDLCVCDRTFEIEAAGVTGECKGVEVFAEFVPRPQEEEAIRKLNVGFACKFGDEMVRRTA